ncbi:putative 2-dehydropantoate 2-reductase [Spirulina major]|uniref:putative 2-dehydropantoate 2-reductase n=1 Tax=Spirulina major TaxID=270636 RepID=UPI0009356092|nr:putative 2-dehydropantoate 2-reductase [Spirulina major]
MTRYAVVGTGAIGGYYGGRLQRAGHAVHFLARSDYDHLQTQGLRVDSVYGDFHLPTVQVYDDPMQMPPCEVVLIALKATQNQQLAKILPPLLAPDTTILVLQNGLGAEVELAAQFPQNPIVGGLCFICSNKVGPGHICHLDYEKVAIAQYGPDYTPCGITPELEHIYGDFDHAGIEIVMQPSLLQSRWEKLVWNIPYNGLSVVLDAQTNVLMEHPPTRQLVEDLMDEVAIAAAACDCRITPKFQQQMLAHTEAMTPYLTSMKLDYEAGRPLEVDAIVGNPLRWATARGAILPKIAMLYQQLQFCDQRDRRL